MIAGPLLLLILPLAMAGIVYILLRWETLSALLAAGTALVLGIAVITLPLDQPIRLLGQRQIVLGETVTFFGRELLLEPSDRAAMAMLFFTTAGIFLLAWRMAPRSLLFPMGLGLLSLLSGALLIRPLIYAALLIEIAAALSVFALQAEDGTSTRGSLRYLTFTTLALPGLLVTHWLLERYAFTPDDTSLLQAADALIIFSFALLLGVVPFHTWVPSTISDSAPLSGVFVLSVSSNVIWFMLFDFLESYPGGGQAQIGSLMTTAGLAMVILGGVLTPVQRRLGLTVGYAVLVDNGAMWVALGMNSKLGLMLVFLSMLMRPFGLILMAAGLSGLQAHNGGDDESAALRGAGWRSPWSTAALAVGGLSVAGMPISAGFVWRWSPYRALSPTHPGAVLILFLAGLAVTAGVWRAVWVLLDRPRLPENRSALVALSREDRWTMGVLLFAILACIGIGLFPQTLTPLASGLTEAYSFFAR
jgi:formate hydrogenlyase subunit 3/multisubunit Na+/H+ antiporter MnhD subunit